MIYDSIINDSKNIITDYINNGNKLNDKILAEITNRQNAIATKQDLNAKLTQLSALNLVDNDVIQQKSGVLANRSPLQLKTDLGLVKADVGLSNVDNTSDINKPISTLFISDC